jgi:hypothetical protein
VLTLVGLAVALVTLASLPIAVLQAIRLAEIVREHRFELAAAGTAVVVGMGAAVLLTRY